MRSPADAAKPLDGLEMLARQKLGRRHEGGLRAGLDRGRHGEQRHDGLAAADIALQQAQHAVGAGEIGVDLAKHAGLRAGELEGKLRRGWPGEVLPGEARGRPALRRRRWRITASAS